MKKISTIALFVLLMSFLPFQKVFALSCMQPPPPEVAIHKYDVVVIATVTEVKDTTSIIVNRYELGSGTLVKADVSLSFKGYSENTITFTEDLQWGESKVGTEYLLFLNEKGNGYESPLCSPTTATAGLNMDKLIETLFDESTSVIELDQLNESNESNESNGSNNNGFSWGWYLLISIIIMLIIIATVILYRRGKGKRNGEK